MTTKELINQYVIAHTGNRRMSASELGTLLTEFAEKLQEPASEDFEAEWKRYCDSKGGGAVTMNVKDVAKHFAQWQKKRMMKSAIEGYVSATIYLAKHCPEDIAEIQVKDSKTAGKVGEKVKVIIIKE